MSENGTQGFIEDFDSVKKHPLAPDNPEFDYAAIDGQQEFDVGVALPDVRDYQDMSRALLGILNFILRGNLNDPRYLKAVGLRVVAMAWVIAPERFDNSSLTTLAKRLGCTTNNISVHVADFSRRFGVRNKYQEHDRFKNKR